MESGSAPYSRPGGGDWSFDGSSDASPAALGLNTASSITPRTSLFSNGTTSSPRTSPSANPSVPRSRATVPPHDSRRSIQARSHSTVADMQSPQPPQLLLNDGADDFRGGRPHISRVEKDADDPTTPHREPLSRYETNTPTRLANLFTVNASMNESRSHSFNALVECRPRHTATEPTSLTGHLYTQGLLSGQYSDVTVNAFSTGYKLHRLLLARAPFFSTAFSGEWIESSSKTITLHPSEVDSNITRHCFELAIKRLYGVPDEQAEAANAAGFFATGCWLEMHDIIDSSIANMLRQMTPENLTPLIRLVTGNYYGRAGDKILASSKAMLCRHGWKMRLRNWDGVPADIVREIVGGDGFYINGEFDRWVLATRILNRRLRKIALETGLVQHSETKNFEAPDVVKLMAVRFDNVYRRNHIRTTAGLPDNVSRWISVYTHPDIEPLLVLLDEGIHYMHLDYEHLQYIRKATDIFGLPFMPDKVVSDALWMQLELRQKVLNATEDVLELGLGQAAEEAQIQPIMVQDSTMSMIKEPSPANGKQREVVVASGSSSEESEDMPSDSWDGNGKPRKFWIPSVDCNIVMGGQADPIVATSPALGTARHVSRLSGTLQPEDVQWVADFGAAAADTRPLPGLRPTSAGGQVSSAPDNRPVSYTHFPPFRFAAEFDNPRLLKGKKRFYSRTIFYGGSLWNIYIQKLRSSKNPQLGVYLHRAKEREAEEALVNTTGLGQGSVDERIGLLEREMLLRHDRMNAQRRRRLTQEAHAEQTLEDDSSGSADVETTRSGADARHQTTRSTPLSRLGDLPYRRPRQNADVLFPPEHTSPTARQQQHSPSAPHARWGDTDTSDEDEAATDPELVRLSATPHVHTLPAYVDARPKIKTYFKIYSPSKGGRMLSVYESVPSNFNFSQSWGWKSSTLMLDEGFAGDAYLGSLSDEAVAEAADMGGVEAEGDLPSKRSQSDGKLRFMVVIGNV
ncbi:hypothetical protein ANO11243_023330 [Dothideomycetidae sp. 11243]|nr:hypothetical protein ANO11243_023330 [fungal sp. No.11243]